MNLSKFLNTKGVLLNDSPLFEQLVANIKKEHETKLKDN